MAGKRKPAKLAIRGVGANKTEEPTERFRVTTPQGELIYLPADEGLTLIDAVRLAVGLVQPASVAQIGPEGKLYPGNVDNSDPFEPVFTPLEPIPVEDEEEE